MSARRATHPRGLPSGLPPSLSLLQRGWLVRRALAVLGLDEVLGHLGYSGTAAEAKALCVPYSGGVVVERTGEMWGR